MRPSFIITTVTTVAGFGGSAMAQTTHAPCSSLPGGSELPCDNYKAVFGNGTAVTAVTAAPTATALPKRTDTTWPANTKIGKTVYKLVNGYYVPEDMNYVPNPPYYSGSNWKRDLINNNAVTAVPTSTQFQKRAITTYGTVTTQIGGAVFHAVYVLEPEPLQKRDDVETVFHGEYHRVGVRTRTAENPQPIATKTYKLLDTTITTTVDTGVHTFTTATRVPMGDEEAELLSSTVDSLRLKVGASIDALRSKIDSPRETGSAMVVDIPVVIIDHSLSEVTEPIYYKSCEVHPRVVIEPGNEYSEGCTCCYFGPIPEVIHPEHLKAAIDMASTPAEPYAGCPCAPCAQMDATFESLIPTTQAPVDCSCCGEFDRQPAPKFKRSNDFAASLMATDIPIIRLDYEQPAGIIIPLMIPSSSPAVVLQPIVETEEVTALPVKDVQVLYESIPEESASASMGPSLGLLMVLGLVLISL